MWRTVMSKSNILKKLINCYSLFTPLMYKMTEVFKKEKLLDNINFDILDNFRMILKIFINDELAIL